EFSTGRTEHGQRQVRPPEEGGRGSLVLQIDRSGRPGRSTDVPMPPPARSWDRREVSMANELAALSQELAGAVQQAARYVVAVHARPRYSSSGVFWRPGAIVTAEHTIRREEEITVTLPDGTNVAATLAGTDPGTDLAVLRVEGAGEPPPALAGTIAPGHLA